MKRRDLLKAIGLGLGWPQGRPGRRRRREAPAWSFRLDDSSRWSLVSRRGLPAVEGGEIAVTLLGRPATPLSALDRVHRVRLADAGNGGAGWQIVGTTSGVEVTAQLLDGPPPLITVTARGLAEPQRLEEIRFLDTSTADVPCLESDDAAGGRPLLWINGYESGDECRLLALDDAGQDTSHWQLAVLPAPVGTSRRRAPAGLALSFGAEDGGRGEFTIASPHLAAASRFSGRPVSMALPPVATSLAVVPGDDPLAALGQLAASHLPSLAGGSPSGWCSWYELGAAVTEADLLDNLAAARERIGPTALHVIQLDDGYQRAAGDWETNAKFPHGHRWLTERIHAAGFRAGLWMAPFAVAERSGIPVGHPDWLLQTAEGQPLVLAEREDWGGKVYGLDAAQRPVRDYLRNLARHAVAEWGYDYLKLDGLGYGAAGTRTDRQLSPAEAYRAGLRALREGAGRAFVVGCHAPLQHAAGLVDGMRIGPDVGTSFDRLQSAARGVALRAHLHASAWLNDPDCLLVREPLTTEEARAWATIVALCGGSSLATDRLDRLPADRVEILQRVMPVAGLPVRARGAPDLSPPGMPEWFLAQVRSDWWVAAAVNWTDGPRPMGLSLAEVGIRGPLAVYDVWAERRLADVDDVVSVAVDAHAVAALALRRRRAVPFVLGSTRHVVQGAVDLAEERWDGRRRSLRGRSVGLDGRPYAVTIALPPGFLPAEAQTDPESDAVIVMGERAARLIVPAPGEEVAWEVRF
jgi:hypothetical protein